MNLLFAQVLLVFESIHQKNGTRIAIAKLLTLRPAVF